MSEMPYFVDEETRRGEVRVAEIVATFALNHNVRYFRLRFPGLRVGQPLGLPPGRHLRLHAKIFDPTSGETADASRSYTPIADADAAARGGEAEFAIKIYSLLDEKSHGVGLFSRHLASLKAGDRLEVSGPRGKLFYVGGGRFQRLSGEVDAYRRVGLVAGGAGITPIIRIIRAFVAELDAAADGALDQFSLLYTNHREEDILFREELETYAREYPNRFRVLFTLTYSRFSANAAGATTAKEAADAAAAKWRSIVPARICRRTQQAKHHQQQPQQQTIGTAAALAADQQQQLCAPSAAMRTTGRINEEMLRQILPSLSAADACKLSADGTDDDDNCRKLADHNLNDETLIFIRGRKEMKKMIEELCEKIGYKNVR